MEFSHKQLQSIEAVKKWYHTSSNQTFYLAGYAGSGKTTLAKHIANELGVRTVYAAYTGKAAYVLRSKGCTDARTIHSLIYHSRENSRDQLTTLQVELEKLEKELMELDLEGPDIVDHPKYREIQGLIETEEENAKEPYFILNQDSEITQHDLVVIDECSMVDTVMGEDLCSFGMPILVLGDPAQLPPINGQGYFTSRDPDFMLDEVHRQAEGNPIIQLATQVRQGKTLEVGDYGSSSVVGAGARLSDERKLAFDQIIVGKNVTRRSINKNIRALLGFEDRYPVLADKLVCLKNNNELGLLNGGLYHVTGLTGVLDQKVHMSVRPENEAESLSVAAWEHYFFGTDKEIRYFELSEAQRFDYGYALTCHKSQGSQWADVCVFDESWVFRQDRNKWLYTAITRAEESVTIIKT